MKLQFAIAAALGATHAFGAGSVTLDSTLPGHASNTIIPLIGGTYTIPASQGFVSGPGNATHNLFYSFLNFNVDTNETAQFTNDLSATYASSSFSNIISRVTGGTSTTINGTIDSSAFPNAKFWFINPAGVTVGAGATLNVPGGFAQSTSDYINFVNGDRWYAIPGNATVANPSVLSTSSPSSFGFLSTNIAIDTTLGTTNSGAITGTGNTYTIDPTYAQVVSNNEFFSFSSFTVAPSDIALFLAPNLQIQNIISRVTGGVPSVIRGVIETGLESSPTTASNANFWFINPAGVTIGSGAQINVPAGLAIGAADYVGFANADRFYADPTQPLTLSLSSPSSLGYLPNTSVGTLSITGWSMPSAQALPYIYLEGSAVSITNSSISAVPASGTGTILIAGETVTIDDSIIGANITAPPQNCIIGIAAVPSLANLSILPVQTTTDFLFGNTAAPGLTSTALVNSFGPALGAITLYNSYVHSDGNVGGGGIYIIGGQITVGGNLGGALASYSNGLDASADQSTPATAPTTLGVHVYGQSLNLNGNNQIDTEARGAGDSGPIDIALTGDLVMDGTHDSYSNTSLGLNGVDYQTALFSQAQSTGNAGDIEIVASNLMLVGPGPTPPPALPTGEAGGPQTPSISSQSTGAGAAGNININIQGTLTMSGLGYRIPAQETVPVVAGGEINSTAASSGPGGNITIVANSVELDDSAEIAAATVGTGRSGSVDLTLAGHLVIDASPYTEKGGGIFSLSEPYTAAGAPTGAPAGNITITSTAADPADGYITMTGSRILSDGSLNDGASGYVSISAPGSIQILAGSTINTSAANGAANQSGPVTITSTASSITIDRSSVVTDSSNAGNAGDVSISALGPVALTDSSVSSQVSLSSGVDPAIVSTAGSVSINSIASTLTVTGTSAGGGSSILSQAVYDNSVSQQQAQNMSAGNVTLQAATDLTLGPFASITTRVYAGNAAGNVTLTASGGVLSVTGNINSQADDGNAGSVSLNGNSVMIAGGADIYTAGQSVYLPAQACCNGGAVSVNGANSVDIENSSIRTFTVSGGTAGDIKVTSGGSITIATGSQLLASQDASTAGGDIAISGNSISIQDSALSTAANLSQGAFGGGPAGNISISGVGLVSLANAGISSTSQQGAGSAGAISIIGSGVLVSDESSISANYNNAGGNPGGPGNILILATGAAGAGDPLSGNLSLPTAGVVRLVDSAVTATNTGGTGINNSVAGLGQIYIGEDLPGTTGRTSNDVIIAGSLVSTDVSAGGIGNNLTISASNGVWIGPSPTGGYPLLAQANSLGVNDIRTSPVQSLITAQTEASAVSGGQILVQGGNGGVMIANSYVDANNAVDGSNSGATFVPSNININVGSTNGAVGLTDSFVTTETSGVDPAGNISITAGSLQIIDGLLAASTTGAGNAGSVTLASSSSLTITDGSAVQTISSSGATGGPISIIGSGVLIEDSSIAADYTSGSALGQPGTIVIQATGSNTNAAPQSFRGQVEPGVVQIDSNSTVSSTNVGGFHLGGLGGTILIGAAPPAGISSPSGSTGQTDAVVISGSEITNNVSEGGSGADLVINGTQGVWIANGSQVLSTTGLVAYSPGQIFILGGPKGVNINQSTVDADNAFEGCFNQCTQYPANAPANIQVTATGGAVSLTNATITAQTTGVDPGGTIAIGGQTVSISGGTITSSSTTMQTGAGGPGDAGNVTITASGANAPNGSASIEIIDGAKIQSTANGTPATPNTLALLGGNAGTVTLLASNGSVQIGLPGDTVQTQISTAAGPQAGAAGAVSITGAGIALGDASLTTTAEGVGANASGGKAGSISLTAGNGEGPLTIANSTLNATTSGTQQAGEIDLSGAQVAISNSSISSQTTTAARAGDINIAGSTVSISGGGVGNDVSVSTTGTGNAGDITITASGANPQGGSALSIDGVSVQSTAAGSAGSIAGNAGKITLSAANGSVSFGDGSEGSTQTTQIGTSANEYAGQAGVVDVSSAGTLTLQNTVIDTSVATTTGSAFFAPGTITLTAPGAVTLTGSTLQATTTGNVAAGDITVTAGGALQITSPKGGPLGGVNTSSSLRNTTAGAAGKIALTGSTLTIDASDVTAIIDGGNAATIPSDIALMTRGAVTVTGGSTIKADTLGGAPGGAIDVGSATSPIASFTANGGATITVDASGSGANAGKGGTLVLDSAGPVILSGAGTALSSNSSNDAYGGSVTITGSSLEMDSGAQVTANTSSSDSASSTGTAGKTRVKATGAVLPIVTGGNVRVTTTGDVALTGAGTEISANATGSGSGGTVTISSGGLSMTDGAIIATTATGAGNSGDITMTVTPSPPVPGGPPTPPILISGNSQITTNADASTGGNITVNAGGSPLTLHDSVINATAGAAGNGGNITINEVGLTILSDSAILARADSGNGGAINIFSIPGALFIEDSESLISAQSKTGNSGTVNINAPQTDLNSGLAVPEVSVARAAELSSNACRHDRNHSTFVREGQGGITQDPDGYLTGQSMNGTAPASSAPAKATKNSAPADRAAVLAAATASSPGCW